MFNSRCLLIFLLNCLLVGCVSSNYTSSNSDENDGNFGIVVMGIKAEGVPYNGGILDLLEAPSVTIEKHEYHDGKLSGQVILPYSSNVEDGYVIFKLPVTASVERYALGFYKRGPASSWKYGFSCKGEDSEVFQVKAGQVIYIGDYRLHSFEASMKGVSWQMDKTSDFSAAKIYLTNKHSELFSKLSQVSPEIANVHIGAGCTR